MKKFIDRVEQLSKKGITYPIGIKHYGKVGKHLEDILGKTFKSDIEKGTALSLTMVK